MKIMSKLYLRIPARMVILLLGLMFAQTNLQAQEPDKVKRELFLKVAAAFEQARREDVPDLAPTLFPKALELYRRAEENYKKGERLSKIHERIEQAHFAIYKAIETAKVSRVALAELLTTRHEATVKREYMKLVPKEFARAESHYQQAILKAEAGDIKAAGKKAEQAMKSYREMLIIALLEGPIKNGEARLKQARSSLSGDTYKKAEGELSTLKKSVRNAKKYKFGIAKYDAEVLAKIKDILAVIHPPLTATGPKDKKDGEEKESVWQELVNLGNQAFEHRDFQVALEAFQKALEIQPDKSEVHLKIAEIYLQRQEFEKARAAFTALLKRDSRNNKARNALGYLLEEKLKNYAGAAEQYQEVLKIDPQNLHALVRLGWVYQQLERLDEAEAALHKALKIDPESSRPESRHLHNYLGSIYLVKGEIDKAMAQFKETLRLFPDDQWAGGQLHWPRGNIRPSDKNYILSKAILSPITAEFAINFLADRNLHQTIDYYDGLGKLSQPIAIKASPSKKDIVTPIEYNELGIQTISHLSYATNPVSGMYQENAIADQRAFFQSAPHVPHSEYPFAETVHEKSPLLRAAELGAAGGPWQPDGRTPASGHTLKTKYRTNEANEVRLWKWNEAASRFQADAFYAAGQLTVTEIKDENGHPAIEFKDKSDRVVLKWVLNIDKNNHQIRLDTYYIYDDFGNLRFIVPPKAVFAMLNSTAWFIDEIRDSKWVTEFLYDGYHRVVENTVPGAQPVYTIYDKLDRGVLIQDGNLRQTNDWLFTKYDILERSVLVGIYHDETHTSRTAMQNYADSYVANVNTLFYETRTSTDYANQQGYTNQAFPPHDPIRLLLVTYYDDYDFNRDGNDDLSFTPDAELEQAFTDWRPFYRLKNKMTGQRIRVLTSIYHQRVEYPEDKQEKKSDGDSDTKPPKADSSDEPPEEDRPDNIRRLGLSGR